jgi:hypothetical protein
MEDVCLACPLKQQYLKKSWGGAAMSVSAAAAISVLTSDVVVNLLIHGYIVIAAFDVYAAALSCRLLYSLHNARC